MPPKPHCKYGNATCKNKVWELAKKIKNKDPKLYRQDVYENNMYKHSYGKDTVMGWNIDHIIPHSNPKSTDDIRNLQALNTHKNKSLQDSKIKKNRHSKCNQ